MVRYREVDPDTIDAFEDAAALAEAQPPVSPYPLARGHRDIRILTLDELLAFELETEGRPVAKQSLIRERFGLHQTNYYQQLMRILDNPEAIEREPQFIRRLTEKRDRELAWRASRTFTR